MPPLTATGQKPNVVVVMMESLARYVGACGAPKTITPYFDSLAADGVPFERRRSAGSHTCQGSLRPNSASPTFPPTNS